PTDLPCLQLEGHDRVSVEVVARTNLSTELRHRVSGRDVDQSEVGINRGNRPDRAASVLPDVAVFRPRLVSWLTGRRHDIEHPQLLAGLRLIADGATAREVVS